MTLRFGRLDSVAETGSWAESNACKDRQEPGPSAGTSSRTQNCGVQALLPAVVTNSVQPCHGVFRLLRLKRLRGHDPGAAFWPSFSRRAPSRNSLALCFSGVPRLCSRVVRISRRRAQPLGSLLPLERSLVFMKNWGVGGGDHANSRMRRHECRVPNTTTPLCMSGRMREQASSDFRPFPAIRGEGESSTRQAEEVIEEICDDVCTGGSCPHGRGGLLFSESL